MKHQVVNFWNLLRKSDFGKWLSDEAHCNLGGYIKKQNCRIWGTENPHAYIEKSMHPKRDTVWAIFLRKWARRCSYSHWRYRYRAMLNESLFTKIKEEDIGNIWFQQDGASCPTAEATLDVWRPVFKAAIWHRWTILCGVPSKLSVTPTSQRQLTL